ncbi:hypothetical protein J6590_014103 [Homalodisca vitripennis]|nr:hypothetical protein J6590_014103 [Homalodisca vitripennis]
MAHSWFIRATIGSGKMSNMVRWTTRRLSHYRTVESSTLQGAPARGHSNNRLEQVRDRAAVEYRGSEAGNCDCWLFIITRSTSQAARLRLPRSLSVSQNCQFLLFWNRNDIISVLRLQFQRQFRSLAGL